MERTITVLSTNSNSKEVFETNATTLQELKRELASRNISYRNMDFMEGLSRTTLIDDNSVLPSNIPYKGVVTNNLVIMLSTTNKHIRSGMYTRKECYELIKKHALQEKILKKCNKNYTNVSTEELDKIVSKEVSNVKKSVNSVKKEEIKSDRPSLYKYVKDNNLGSVIKEKTGKNYTNVSTKELYSVVKSLSGKTIKKDTTKVKCPFTDKELAAIKKSFKK